LPWGDAGVVSQELHSSAAAFQIESGRVQGAAVAHSDQELSVCRGIPDPMERLDLERLPRSLIEAIPVAYRDHVSLDVLPLDVFRMVQHVLE